MHLLLVFCLKSYEKYVYIKKRARNILFQELVHDKFFWSSSRMSHGYLLTSCPGRKNNDQTWRLIFVRKVKNDEILNLSDINSIFCFLDKTKLTK